MPLAQNREHDRQATAYREIRVRPVVRYIVTEFTSPSADADGSGTSIEFGEFDNPDRANVVANLLAYDGPARNGGTPAVTEDCPRLKITKLGGCWMLASALT